MLLDTAATGFPPLDLTKIVLAIGALGTAAYGLVDVSKGFGGGGISNRGFGDIKKSYRPSFPHLLLKQAFQPSLWIRFWPL